jgi:hypothetical protein
MVWPFTFSAAIPVGARTKTLLSVFSINCFINVVLPVPAFPVRKKDLLVFSNKSNAIFQIPSRSSFSINVVIDKIILYQQMLHLYLR